MISIKMWETPLSWHAKCSFPVAVRVSLPNRELKHARFWDSGVSHIFILIISNGEKILSNVNLVVWRQVKRENSSLPGPSASQKRARLSSLIPPPQQLAMQPPQSLLPSPLPSTPPPSQPPLSPPPPPHHHHHHHFGDPIVLNWRSFEPGKRPLICICNNQLLWCHLESGCYSSAHSEPNTVQTSAVTPCQQGGNCNI